MAPSRPDRALQQGGVAWSARCGAHGAGIAVLLLLLWQPPVSGQDAPSPDALADAPPAAPGAVAPDAPAVAPSCVFERYVSVVPAAGFDPHLAEEVRKDLAAELSSRGFGVCPERATHGELVAEITLVQREPQRVAIQVDDHTTGKSVARDVRLARIPTGGVALALAIAADELLRASWAELMLRRSAEERAAREAAAVNEPVQTSSESRRFVPLRRRMAPVPAALVLAFDYAHTLKNWDGLGVDLRLQLRPFRYGFLEIGGGGGSALPVKGTFGTARAAGALALLTLGGCGALVERVLVCAGARGSFQWTRFRGEDARDAKARHVSLTSFVLAALAQLQVKVAEHAFVLGELSLGGALVSARATDRDGTLLGIEGFVFGAAVGAGYAP